LLFFKFQEFCEDRYGISVRPVAGVQCHFSYLFDSCS
jgi:hypothetical protein